MAHGKESTVSLGWGECQQLGVRKVEVWLWYRSVGEWEKDREQKWSQGHVDTTLFKMDKQQKPTV